MTSEEIRHEVATQMKLYGRLWDPSDGHFCDHDKEYCDEHKSTEKCNARAWLQNVWVGIKRFIASE